MVVPRRWRNSQHSVVRKVFPGLLTSLRGNNGLPPRSPDLRLTFFSSAISSPTYKNITLEALKEIITQEVKAIIPDLSRRVMDCCREWLDRCINNGGSYLNDIVKTQRNDIICVLNSLKFPILLSFVLLASIIRELFLPHPE